MILGIMTFIYDLCDLVAIGTGATVLFGLLTGELLQKWAVVFLRFVLATSVIGLLFPFPHLLLSQREEISMLTVYASGVPILAWRRFHLVGVWRPVFALSATLVLYLSVLGAISQAFSHVSLFNALVLRQFKSPIFITHVIVMLLFVVLGIVAARRFRGHTPVILMIRG